MSWARESRFRSPTRLDGARIDSPSPQAVPAVWVPVKIQTSPTRMPSPGPSTPLPVPIPLALPSPPHVIEYIPEETRPAPSLAHVSCGTCEVLQAQLDDALDQIEILRKDVVNAQAKLILQQRPADHSMVEHYKNEASRAQNHLHQREVEWSEEWSSKENSLIEKHDQEVHKLTIELEDAEGRIAQLMQKNKELAAAISNTVVASPAMPPPSHDDSELIALQQRCEEAENLIESLTTDKKELNRTIMLLKTNLQKAEYSLHEHSHDAGEDTAPLHQQIESLTTDLDEKRAAVVSLQKEVSTLRQSLEKSKAAQQTAKNAALASLEDEVSSLRLALETAERDKQSAVAPLQDEVSTLRLALESAKKGNSLYSEKAQAQIEELNDDVRRLKKELEAATDEAARAEKRSSVHDTEKSHYETSLATLKKKLEAATAAEDTLAAEKQKLQGDIERLRDELDSAKGETKRVESLRERERATHEDSLTQAVNRAKGSLEHERAVLKETVESLNRLLEEAREEMAEMKTRHEHAIEQLKATSAVERARLQEKLSAAKSEADEETLTASRLESDVSRLTLELQGAQEELSRLTTMYGRSLETIDTERGRHKAAMKELSSQFEEDRAKKDELIHTLKEQLMNVNEDLEAKENELRLVQMKITGKLDEADSVHADYKRQLQQAANKTQMLEIEIQHLTRRNTELEAESEEVLTRTSSLEQLTQERNAASKSFAALERDITQLREQLDTRVAAHNEEVSDLQAANTKLVIELDSATRQLNILKEETDKRVGQLKERIASADESNSDQAQEIIQLKCTVEMLEMEKSRLEMQMKNKAMEGEAMESRVARLKEAANHAAELEDTFDEVKAEKEKLKSEMENLVIDLEESRRGYKRMKAKLETEEQQHAEAKVKVEGLQKKLNDAWNDLQNLQDVNERQKKQIGELQSMEDEVLLRQSSSEADLKKAGSVMMDQSTEIQNLKARLTRAQDNEQAALSKLQTLTAEYEALVASYDSLKTADDAKLEERVSKLRAELAAKESETEEKIGLLKQKENTLLKLEEEIAKQKEEIEFIVFTRSELVQAIMDLRKTVKEAVKEHHKYFAKDPAFRRASVQGSTGTFKISAGYMADAVRAVKTLLDSSLERVNGIAGRYLTDYEKMHHGSSPQHFDEKHNESCNLFDKIVQRRKTSSSPTSPSRPGSPRKMSEGSGPLVLQHPKEVAPSTPREGKEEKKTEKSEGDDVTHMAVLPSDLSEGKGAKTGVLSTKELENRLSQQQQPAAAPARSGTPVSSGRKAAPRSLSRSNTASSHLRSTTPKGKGYGQGNVTRTGSGGGLKFIDSTRNPPKRKGF